MSERKTLFEEDFLELLLARLDCDAIRLSQNAYVDVSKWQAELGINLPMHRSVAFSERAIPAAVELAMSLSIAQVTSMSASG
jgi:hypothetical protein